MLAALRKRGPGKAFIRGETVDFAYDNNKNLGDALNVPVLEYFGAKFRHVAYGEAQMVGIGSILSRITTRSADVQRSYCDYIDIWGSGFVENSGDDSERFIKNVKIHALRGELSKRRCEEILGAPLTGVPLGDPGLLVSRVFPTDAPAKDCDVGIIPHYIDKESPALANVRLMRHSFKTIDVQKDPAEVIKEILGCKVILSSAMHGLIVADSYGIPNRWIQLSDEVYGAGYKFRDYYSAFGARNTSPIDTRAEVIDDDAIDRIASEYADSTVEIARICDELCRSFPRKTAIVLPMRSIEDAWVAAALSEVDGNVLAPERAKPIFDRFSLSFDLTIAYYEGTTPRFPRADVAWDAKKSIYRIGGREYPLVVPRMIADRCRVGWTNRKGILTVEDCGRSPKDAWDQDRLGKMLSVEFVRCPRSGRGLVRTFVEAVMCGAIPIVGAELAAFEGFVCRAMSESISDLKYDEEAALGNYSRFLDAFCLPRSGE